MLKTCTVCGRIHAMDNQCQPRRDDSKAARFRQGRHWKNKSIAIRERDHYLCQCCIRNLYDTGRMLNCDLVEVHHIVPVGDNYDLRLEDDNLISLCHRHHEAAEAGRIGRGEMREWLVCPPVFEIKK